MEIDEMEQKQVTSPNVDQWLGGGTASPVKAMNEKHAHGIDQQLAYLRQVVVEVGISVGELTSIVQHKLPSVIGDVLPRGFEVSPYPEGVDIDEFPETSENLSNIEYDMRGLSQMVSEINLRIGYCLNSIHEILNVCRLDKDKN